MKLIPDRKKFLELLGSGNLDEDMQSFVSNFSPLLAENHAFLVSLKFHTSQHLQFFATAWFVKLSLSWYVLMLEWIFFASFLVVRMEVSFCCSFQIFTMVVHEDGYSLLPINCVSALVIHDCLSKKNMVGWCRKVLVWMTWRHHEGVLSWFQHHQAGGAAYAFLFHVITQ